MPAKSESTPLITIIVAVFNGAKTLQQCIDSVAQQSYANKELIVIDGGSKDGTVELLEANNGFISYWISEPDQGIYNAWNKALVQAKGDWICFLGADDFLWNAKVLEQCAEYLLSLPTDIDIAYGKVMLLSGEGEAIYSVGEDWQKTKKTFFQYMSIPHQGVMHRTNLFKRRGGFDESFRIAGDYELLLRELKTASAGFIPDIIVTGMRQGGMSSNPIHSLQTMREIRRAQKMNGQRLPGKLWITAMLRVYIKLVFWRFVSEKQAKQIFDIGRQILELPKYWTHT